MSFRASGVQKFCALRKQPCTLHFHHPGTTTTRESFEGFGRKWHIPSSCLDASKKCSSSGKEKAHKHKQVCPVTAWVGGVLPTGWPGVKCLCAVCGSQETYVEILSGYPAGRIGDRGDREIVYVPNVYVPFLAPMSMGNYQIYRPSKCLWLKIQDAPKAEQNVRGFWVRTPICQMVPISRVGGGGRQRNRQSGRA